MTRCGVVGAALLALTACRAPRDGFFAGEFLDTYAVARLPGYDGYYDTIWWQDDVLAVGSGQGVELVNVGRDGELTPRARLGLRVGTVGLGIDLEVWDDALWAVTPDGLFEVLAHEGDTRSTRTMPALGGLRFAFGDTHLAVAQSYSVALYPLDAITSGEATLQDAVATIAVDDGDFIQTLRWEGTRLWVGTTSNGALVYDTSVPTAPSLVRQFGRDVNCAYIGPFDGRMLVATQGDAVLWDVTDLADPKFVAVYRGMGRDVVVHGDYMYGVDGGASLTITDVRDPDHPRPVMSGQVDGSPWSVAVNDDAIFVSAHTRYDEFGAPIDGGLVRLQPNAP